MDTNDNDYDSIANEIGKVIAQITGNAHEPRAGFSDSITITKDGFIGAVIQLQRLRDWVEGLAASHRAA